MREKGYGHLARITVEWSREARDLPLHWGGTAKREIIRRLNKGAGNLAGRQELTNRATRPIRLRPGQCPGDVLWANRAKPSRTFI